MRGRRRTGVCRTRRPPSSGSMKSGIGSPGWGALCPTLLASSRATMRSTMAANSGLSRRTSSATAFNRSQSGASMSRLLLVASSRISANVFSAIGLARSLRRSRRCHRGNRECATAVVPRHQLCPAWRYRRYHACLQPRPERFDFYAHICRATMQRIDSRELSSRPPHGAAWNPRVDATIAHLGANRDRSPAS